MSSDIDSLDNELDKYLNNLSERLSGSEPRSMDLPLLTSIIESKTAVKMHDVMIRLERSSKRLERWSSAIVILTICLILLTIVLILRP